MVKSNASKVSFIVICGCCQLNVRWLIVPTNLVLPSKVNNQKEILNIKNDTKNILLVSCFHDLILEFGCSYQLILSSPESIHIVL